MHGDVSSQTADQCAHMRETNPFARPVLWPGAPEKFKNPLKIPLGYPSSVVANLNCRIAVCDDSRHMDNRLSRRVGVLNRVVKKVAENLLQRKPVGDNTRQAR